MEQPRKKFNTEMANQIREKSRELRKKRQTLKKLEEDNPDVALREDDNVPGNRVYHLFQEMTALRADIRELEAEINKITK